MGLEDFDLAAQADAKPTHLHDEVSAARMQRQQKSGTTQCLVQHDKCWAVHALRAWYKEVT